MSEIKQVWGIIKDYQCAELQMVQGPALAVWKSQQSIIDDLIYKAKLRESDHRALLVKYQATKKCWEDVSGKCEELKTQLNNMDACYIQVKKDRDGLQVRASELLEGVESAMVQLDNWTTAYEILDELRGERESFTETRQKVEAQIENGARLTKHQIDL